MAASGKNIKTSEYSGPSAQRDQQSKALTSNGDSSQDRSEGEKQDEQRLVDIEKTIDASIANFESWKIKNKSYENECEEIIIALKIKSKAVRKETAWIREKSRALKLREKSPTLKQTNVGEPDSPEDKILCNHFNELAESVFAACYLVENTLANTTIMNSESLRQKQNEDNAEFRKTISNLTLVSHHLKQALFILLGAVVGFVTAGAATSYIPTLTEPAASTTVAIAAIAVVAGPLAGAVLGAAAGYYAYKHFRFFGKSAMNNDYRLMQATEALATNFRKAMS